MGEGSTHAGSARIVYLMRHAESRYNQAVQQWDVAKMVGETDHGLSTRGLAQCRTLQTRIGRDDASDEDASKLRSSNRMTVSSPLCRAILTAHLALPPCPNPIIALPEAREHCMVPLFSRDSEGTSAPRLPSHVCSELSELIRVAGSGPAELEAPAPPPLDLSRLPADKKWWTVAEAGSSVDSRLGAALRALADVADAHEDAATVLVGHSHAMRRLFRNHATEAFKGTKLGRRLGEEVVANCAILRVRLEDVAGASRNTPPSITDAELLFGSTFKGDLSCSLPPPHPAGDAGP